MVPAWVLLKREILFEHDASAFGGASDSMRRPRSGEGGEKSMRRARSGEDGEISMRRARSRHQEDERGETAQESIRRARSRHQEEGSTRRSRSRHDDDLRGGREESMRRVKFRQEEGDSVRRASSRHQEEEEEEEEGEEEESIRGVGSRHEVMRSARSRREEDEEEWMRRTSYRHEKEEVMRSTRSRREEDEEEWMRRTSYRHEEEEDSWRRGSAGPSCTGGTSTTVKVPSRQDIKDAILVYLQSVKPDAHFANPPQLSSLRLLRPTKSIPQLCEDIFSVVIASADKNLVALYAGPYRPGNNLKGGYLIYDTSKNSLSAVPQPPYDYSRADIGLGSVVLSLKEGKEDTYLLAELTKKRGCTPPKAALSIWRPSAAEWVMYPASFPPELCVPNCVFQADMCFSYRDSVLCWVDLFKGMLICDLMLHIDGRPKFRYIPLPQQSMAYDRFEHPWRAEEFRSVACVDGSIKFVTMDGYGHRPGNELSLTAWTLSADLCHWNKVNECFVRDIWESNNYLQSGLPKILPLFPVLSMNEDDVVYLVVTRRKVVGCQVEYMGQYLLRVDMQHHKVSFCPQNTEQIRSQPFASQCSAYVSAYHKGKVKARKVEACKDKELIWCT